MNFYEIENPTTEQIFEAIISNEYTPLEKIKPKAKQIEILLKDCWGADEILITATNVTNTGSRPIFLADGTSLHEVASEENPDFFELSEEKQDEEIELLGSYLRSYREVFNIKELSNFETLKQELESSGIPMIVMKNKGHERMIQIQSHMIAQQYFINLIDELNFKITRMDANNSLISEK